ncbi:MAG: outer membrane protein assembly factor BamA [Verrucomicrobia bacterium]|nr:outer membrane protein assembly factor BamA [Verrucomicrobiota bacterium]
MSKTDKAKASPLAGCFALPRSLRSRLVAEADRSLLLLLSGFLLLFAWLPAGWAQFAPLKIIRIDIKHIGPANTSDELIRSNLRVKVGDIYLRAAVDDDVRNLYATGFFWNIQVKADNKPEGVILTYEVQGRPRLEDIKFQGNTKFKSSKLLKKISSKIGEPLDERKLFTDTQEIQKMYQKKGYQGATNHYELTIDEPAGRSTAKFVISEKAKVKILKVEFVGAKAFPMKKLRKTIKTRKHWMFSWLTGSGVFKSDQFDEDKEKLTELYRDKGYIDFEIKDVKFERPTPQTLIIRFIVYEGTQYKVGAVKFTGNKLFTVPEITQGMRLLHERSRSKAKIGPNGLTMDVGGIFTPGGVTKDIESVEDFYGSKGYIDVTAASRHLFLVRIPNTETGTMDLEFQIDEGKQYHIEKIEIKGNIRTKDKVIRRELAVSPGEVFDMVRVKLSKQRLEGLNYFTSVDTRSEAFDAAGRKNLVVDVDEKTTGHVSLGAGFSTVDSLVGIAEYNEGNYQAPWFRGGGQKFRLKATVGTVRQDYELTFIEPWFLGRKLQFSFDLYYRDYAFMSPNDIYTITRGGAKVGVERALGSDFLRGGLSYSVENVGVSLAGGANQYPAFSFKESNVPNDIFHTVGSHILSTAGASLAYDTRNSTKLPNKGQRTELVSQLTGGPLGGSYSFYRLELHTAHYFPGFLPGHVLEIGGRAGVVEEFGRAPNVPFFERYYLGGLTSLRGFKYRYISPRQVPNIPDNEPIGGDTYWFGSAEYSIPIYEAERGVGLRFAVFYDAGSVGANPYNPNFARFSDNWGLGIRINLPIGPLRLDYGIPMRHDQYSSTSGKLQFGVGWERPF